MVTEVVRPPEAVTSKVYSLLAPVMREGTLRQRPSMPSKAQKKPPAPSMFSQKGKPRKGLGAEVYS